MSATIPSMITNRTAAGVPAGMLTGHVPLVDNWIYSYDHDVTPYAWSSKCNLSANRTMDNVHFNTSLLIDAELTYEDALNSLSDIISADDVLAYPDAYYDQWLINWQLDRITFTLFWDNDTLI